MSLTLFSRVVSDIKEKYRDIVLVFSIPKSSMPQSYKTDNWQVIICIMLSKFKLKPYSLRQLLF